MTEECRYRGPALSTRKNPDFQILKCEQHGKCVLQATHLDHAPGIQNVHVCDQCTDRKPPRAKANFCYFTASNRPNEPTMIETMIKSARAAGAQEDFHVFAVADIPNVINHRIAPSFPWKNHMGKIDCLKQLASLDYDYFVWVDTDNYFVRDPGDLSELIRNNPIWVSMEEDINRSVHGDWWEMRFNTKPSIIDVLRSFGITRKEIWSTNGGMWIVRKEAIKEFSDRTFAAWERLKQIGYPRMSDEPPLAVVAQTWLADAEQNTFDKHSHIWACDWVGRYQQKLPDGKPWLYKDWMTQKETGPINPAIVHNMRGKHLMGYAQHQVSAGQLQPTPSKEPVGTKLAEILRECGATQPAGCDCKRWIMQMDAWGIQGCQQNRSAIVNHLNDAATKATWLAMAGVVARGYVSTNALLDEAIKRAG